MTKKCIKLMIPGPVEVSEEVLDALHDPVEPHYGPQWIKTWEHVKELLKLVFGTKEDVYLMTGSGSCALDACMGSSLMTGEKIIVGNNGYFGDRLVSIARHNGLQVIEVKEDWGKKLDPKKIFQVVQENPDAKAVTVVHSETSTTVLNPIDEIGISLKDTSVLFIVDAVSALGGVPYKVDNWGIDLCASASQKCLGSIPGLAPVSVSKKAWGMIDRSDEKAHGWFTDLRIWRKFAVEWADWHPTPVTVSSNQVNALTVALEQLKAEGIENRMARYRETALFLRAGLRKIGMEPMTVDAELNPVLTAAYMPEGVNSGDVVTFLKENHHIQISGGLGSLKPKIIRIGHMSPVVTKDDMEKLLDALATFPG